MFYTIDYLTGTCLGCGAEDMVIDEHDLCLEWCHEDINEGDEDMQYTIWKEKELDNE